MWKTERKSVYEMIAFSIPNGSELCLKENVWDQFLLLQKKGEFTTENGGILIGQLNPAEKRIILTDFTDAKETDIRARFHFFRSEKYHQKTMDELWVASDYTKTYLGEWHTHDEDVPSPSTTDIKEWRRISKGQHNSSVLFFIIIGRRKIRIWTINHGNVTAVSGGK